MTGQDRNRQNPFRQPHDADHLRSSVDRRDKGYIYADRVRTRFDIQCFLSSSDDFHKLDPE